MFRMLRERRQRREREARERRENLRNKAGAPLQSLLPGEPYADGVAENFANALIAQVENTARFSAETDGRHVHSLGSHSHTVSGSGNHSHSVGSHSHTASDSGSHSHSYSHDSSSYDSGSSW